MSINQRKAGVVLSYLSEGVKILTGLVYTPVMLRLLGSSEYGLYQLVYSVISYLGLLSMGFGSSYMRFYSKYKAEDDEKKIATLNGMFLVIFISISAICILSGSVLVLNARAVLGSGLTEGELSKAKVLMAFMVFNLAITFPNSVFNCIVTSQERFVFQKTLILLQSLLNPFLTLPLLLLGYGSVGMVLISTILTIAVFICNVYYSIRRLFARFIFRGFKWSLLKEMWIFTFFIFLNKIIDQVNWSLDKYLLGRMIGTSAVALYGVGGQINSMYLQFSTSISNVFVPKVNRLVAERKNMDEISRLFTKVGRIQFIVMGLVLSGFVFFGKSFVMFWAGSEYIDAYYVTIVLIAPVTIPLVQNLGIEIQRAQNKHKTRSIVYSLIAIANVFISIPLIMAYGPLGAAIGTAIALVAGNILFMNWYYHKHLGIDMIMFWKNILSFLPALMPVVGIGLVMNFFVEFDSILKLAIGITAYTIVYCLAMYLWGMNREEKALVMGFKSILKKRKKDPKQ